jgi:hypothetical protein
MKILLFFTLTFFLHFTAHAEDAFSTVEERMSGKEFKETGLSKLTDDELANLNDWLRRHSVATLENASARPSSQQIIVQSTNGDIPLTTNDKRGLGYLGVAYDHDADGKVIYGTLNGTFSGSNGEGTLFKLTNGMVWEQTEKDSFSINSVVNPDITITKNFIGNWQLSVVGHDSEVRVKRIR